MLLSGIHTCCQIAQLKKILRVYRTILGISENFRGATRSIVWRCLGRDLRAIGIDVGLKLEEGQGLWKERKFTAISKK